MLKTDLKHFPNKRSLQNKYDEYFIYFSSVIMELELLIRETIHLSSIPTLKSRVKKFSSYYSKILKSHYVDTSTFPVISDLIGLRVICPFLEDLDIVEKQLASFFKIIEIEKKGSDRTFSEFGYESTHILVEIPEIVKKNKILPKNLICEIQVRTILQDAWAEVEHELVYKAEFSPFDLPLKRKLASMNASLSLADIIFQEIRDYQKKLDSELDCRRAVFYDKTDATVKESFQEVFHTEDVSPISIEKPSSPYVQGSIDDLLLEAIHLQNTKDFTQAIKIYTQIIESVPRQSDVVLAVILNHRGMAFFAQNQFDLSFCDFEKSTVLNPNNSRSWYYLGILNCILHDDNEAIKSFSKSLELNEYQSHVYYRRSLSLYHLGDYTSALSDLSIAMDLGLENDDVKKLHTALLRKLDIK
ncbi:MAG: (p)ppGpp synthetase [Treponemataceae bacterium]